MLREQVRHPAQVDWSRLRQPGDAPVGDRHHDATPVRIRLGSTNEAFIDEPGNATGHARPRDERPVREFRHAQLAVAGRQLSEHVEVGQGQTRIPFEIRVESAHERGVSPQERVPSSQPTTARQLVLYEPVQELSDISLRNYLHMHLLRVRYLQEQAYRANQRWGRSGPCPPNFSWIWIRPSGLSSGHSRVTRG